MDVYILTKLGKGVVETATSKDMENEDMRVLEYFSQTPRYRATSDQLDRIYDGGHLIAEKLVEKNLLVRLTPKDK
jgi:hypothetical protein